MSTALFLVHAFVFHCVFMSGGVNSVLFMSGGVNSLFRS